VPIIIRCQSYEAFPAELVRILQAGKERYALEFWSEDRWHCPHCASPLTALIHSASGQYACPRCCGLFWARTFAGPVLITCSDDPAGRKLAGS